MGFLKLSNIAQFLHRRFEKITARKKRPGLMHSEQAEKRAIEYKGDLKLNQTV